VSTTFLARPPPTRQTVRKGRLKFLYSPAQESYDLPARYSLVISIRTHATEVDLYTPMAQQVTEQLAVPLVVGV